MLEMSRSYNDYTEDSYLIEKKIPKATNSDPSPKKDNLTARFEAVIR